MLKKKVVFILRPYLLLLSIFLIITILVYINTDNNNSYLCGTIKKIEKIDAHGVVGMVPVGFEGYLCEIILENTNQSIKITTTIENLEKGQKVTLLQVQKKIFQKSNFELIKDSFCNDG